LAGVSSKAGPWLKSPPPPVWRTGASLEPSGSSMAIRAAAPGGAGSSNVGSRGWKGPGWAARSLRKTRRAFDGHPTVALAPHVRNGCLVGRRGGGAGAPRGQTAPGQPSKRRQTSGKALREGTANATARPWLAGRRGERARGVTGRVVVMAGSSQGKSAFALPTVADGGGPARPLPTFGEASSVRGEEPVAAGLDRFRRGKRRTSGLGKGPVLRRDRIQGQGSPVSP
jgi:hypothetical protein